MFDQPASKSKRTGLEPQVDPSSSRSRSQSTTWSGQFSKTGLQRIFQAMNLGTQMYETYAPVSAPSPPGILTLLAAFQIRDDKYHFDLPRKLNEVCHFCLFDTEGVRCFAELIKMLTSMLAHRAKRLRFIRWKRVLHHLFQGPLDGGKERHLSQQVEGAGLERLLKEWWVWWIAILLMISTISNTFLWTACLAGSWSFFHDRSTVSK